MICWTLIVLSLKIKHRLRTKWHTMITISTRPMPKTTHRTSWTASLNNSSSSFRQIAFLKIRRLISWHRLFKSWRSHKISTRLMTIYCYNVDHKRAKTLMEVRAFMPPSSMFLPAPRCTIEGTLRTQCWWAWRRTDELEWWIGQLKVWRLTV